MTDRFVHIILFPGYLLKSTKMYREILKGGFLLAISATVLFLSMLYSNNITGLTIAFGIMGEKRPCLYSSSCT
jgi:hypothetical protein